MKICFAGPFSLARLASALRSDVPDYDEFPPVSDYLLELIARGHSVEAVMLSTAVTTTTSFFGDRINATLLPLRRSARTADFYQKEIRLLRSFYRATECDLIHAQWPYEYAAAGLEQEAPLLVTAHDAPLTIARYTRPLRYWGMRAVLALTVVPRLRHLVAISPYLAQYYKRWHAYGQHISVIPEFTAQLTGSALCQFSGKEFKTGSIIFGSVLNGWGKRKNSSTLIRAFKMVRSAVPSARLILFGTDHGNEGQARVFADDISASAGIEFAGLILNEQLIRRLALEVDVLVHPSLEEAFGIAIADSMALGIPVIGGVNSGAVPWLLGEGACGILCDVRCAEKMAAAMLEIASNACKRSQLASAGKQRAERLFSLRNTTNQYELLYQTIVNAH
jgi:glycosyltransferase involved in cell wall biosynthesis